MISGSIVLYHTPLDQLKSIVESCFNSNDLECLFLVDNSIEKSSDILEYINDFNKIKYIFLGENIGYGAAHNLAMRKSIEMSFVYHVVLNPDITFSSDVLTGLKNKMKSSPKLAHIMPKICYPNGDTQYLCKLLPTPFDLFLRRFLPFKILKESHVKRYELQYFDYDLHMADVPSLSGCFMFFRLEAVNSVGFFDENIFMYMEDVDFSRRILERFSNLYFPDFTVYHAYEKGSYKNNKLLAYHLRSAFYYFCKWGWFFDSKRKKINNEFSLKNLN